MRLPMNTVTFTYTNPETNGKESYVVKWESVECVWIGDDDQEFDVLDQVRTELMHSGCKDVGEVFA